MSIRLLSSELLEPSAAIQVANLFASSPIAMGVLDTGGHVVRANPAFQHMTGYSQAELEKMSLSQLIHPDDLAEHQRQFAALIGNQRNQFRIVRRYRHRNNHLLWVQTTISSVRLVGDEIDFITLCDEDISERRKGEEALQAIAEGTFSASGGDFFRSLVRHLATALDVPYALVTECTNPAKSHVRALAFWKEEHHVENYEYDLAGTPCQRVVQEDALSYYPQDVQKLFPADGDLAALEAQGYLGIPIYDSLGNVLGHLFVMDRKAMDSEPRGLSILKIFAARAGAELERKRRDAEREKLIAELRDANEKALESARLKSEFLATMSHELRTPLNSVIGFAGILREGMAGEINATASPMIDAIFDSSQHLLALINDILDLSKIEAGRLEIEDAPVKLPDLITQWRRQMEMLGREKSLGVELYVEPGIPDVIFGDKERIAQIVGNLLSNAFKFTLAGKVTLVMKSMGSNLVIEVHDTGIGIPPHAHDYIFDEFRQVNGSYNRSQGGAGLGLAIVRKLCRAMNGNIALVSEAGKGSVFTVTLPLRRVAIALVQAQEVL